MPVPEVVDCGRWGAGDAFTAGLADALLDARSWSDSAIAAALGPAHKNARAHLVAEAGAPEMPRELSSSRRP